MQVAEQVTNVIQMANLLDFAKYYGVDLDNSLKTKCFAGHDNDEKTLQFDPENQAFYCTRPDCRFHGNAIDLVQMKEEVDFTRALTIVCKIADLGGFMAGHPEELFAPGKVRDCLRAAGQFYTRNLESAMPFLDIRGTSRTTAERFLIGATRGETGLKDFLIGNEFPDYVIKQAGLLNKDGQDFFRDRIIVPIRVAGQIVALYGRAFDENAAVKHLRMSNERVIIGSAPFNWNPNRAEIIVTEGIFDALSLIDQGFTNAIATYGTQGLCSSQNSELLNDSPVKRVFLCYDGDEAGTKATMKDAYVLEDHGLEVKIVNIGDQDPNEFIINHGPEVFKDRLSNAVSPVHWEINRVDPSWDAERKIVALETVFRRCKNLKPLHQVATIDRIVKLGFPKTIVQKHIASLADKNHDLPSLIDLSVHVNIHPALEFVNGKTLMMVPQMIPNGENGKAVWIPYMVTSEREMFSIEPEELHKRSYYTETDVIPVRPRYSPKNIAGFLEGKVTGDLSVAYRRIRSVLIEFLDFEDERTHDYLTTWTIGTYFFPIFNYYPYIHFTGTKNVGKSKTMSLLACLCFNAVASASMTAAALFRAVDSWRCTVLMDETEYLHQREFTDKRLILNGGFQKGSYVSRTEKEGDKYRVRQLHNYCPKAFASIEGLDDTLASRAVQIYMHRSQDDAIKEREVQIESPMFQALRDDLFLVAMTYGEAIDNIYASLDRPGGVQFGDREFNLFKPILTIGMATQNEKIVTSLIDYANTSYRQKMLLHNDTAEENVLLRYLLEMVVEDGWYRGDTIHEGFINFLRTNGLDLGRQITKSRMGQLIRKLKVVSEDRRSADRKTTVYRIERPELEKVAQNYQVI
ncbi:MAG: toprim domain-containing protein [Desulfomonilaceae bacterium]